MPGLRKLNGGHFNDQVFFPTSTPLLINPKYSVAACSLAEGMRYYGDMISEYSFQALTPPLINPK